MAEGQRDRREDGRPEQGRPRDRTGRPLPYDSTGVPLTEEHDPSTVEEALRLGERLWNEQRFFEAHECLEAVWHAAPEPDRDLWQGVIQVAVAAVHVQRGNPVGASKLLDRAATRLARYPDGHRGIAVDAARETCRRLQDDLDRDGVDEVRLPGAFPASPEGAWFAAEASATGPSPQPTPVPDEPVWLAAGQRRRPQQRGSPST